MLTASRLKVREGTTIIAGNSSGRKILCSNRVLPNYNNLVKLSNSGNYWATLIVKSIVGLTSGRLAKDNIYIKKGTSIAYGKGDAFYLVLPGVTASLDEHPNGGFILQTLNIDKQYEEDQNNAREPGLWRVNSNIRERPEHMGDGSVTKIDIRPVVISDMTESQLLRVIPAVHESLIDVEATRGTTQNYGFDLHFTPGGSGIMGLKKAKDAISTDKDKKIIASAMLLANTMYQAHKQKGVIWFSDYGGSAILTRALQILHREKGVTLENHSIFMNHPTSMSKEAIVAAEALGLTEFNKKTGALNPKEFIGHFTLNEKSGSKTAKASLTGLSAAGAAFGFAGASLTTAGLVGLAGGMVFVGKALFDGVKNTKLQKY
jgi:hypothetical protein